jgi:hypothetical protein
MIFNCTNQNNTFIIILQNLWVVFFDSLCGLPFSGYCPLIFLLISPLPDIVSVPDTVPQVSVSIQQAGVLEHTSVRSIVNINVLKQHLMVKTLFHHIRKNRIPVLVKIEAHMFCLGNAYSPC